MTELNASKHLEERLYPAFKVFNAIGLADEMGLDADRVLSGSDLTRNSASQVSTRVSLGQVARIYQNFVDMDLGVATALRLGARLGPHQYGAYGLAVSTSRNMADGFETIFTYGELETSTVLMRLRLDEEGDRSHFVFSDNLQIVGLLRFNIESHMATVLNFFDRAFTDDLRPIEFWFSYPKPSDADDLAAHLPAPARYGKPYNAIVFPRSWLQIPLRDSHPITHAMMARECARQVQDLRADQQTASLVLRILREDLAVNASIEAVARRLSVSSRTLRRRLDDEGTSFTALLEQARLRSAVHMLKNNKASAEEVSYRLGYSAPSNFRTAFKRWTGLTVGQFRALEQPKNRDRLQ